MSLLDKFEPVESNAEKLRRVGYKIGAIVEYVGTHTDRHGVYKVTYKSGREGHWTYMLIPYLPLFKGSLRLLEGARHKSVKETAHVSVSTTNSSCSACGANIHQDNIDERCYGCDLIFTHEDHSWYMPASKVAVFGLPMLTKREAPKDASVWLARTKRIGFHYELGKKPF